MKPFVLVMSNKIMMVVPGIIILGKYLYLPARSNSNKMVHHSVPLQGLSTCLGFKLYPNQKPGNPL